MIDIAGKHKRVFRKYRKYYYWCRGLFYWIRRGYRLCRQTLYLFRF